MTCSDLCTAAKCQELENRIGVLEQELKLLEASFQAHTKLEIPEAHDYTPPDNHVESNLNINGSFENNVLNLTVADGESQDTTQITIPLPEIPDIDNHIKSNLSLSASWESEVLTISVADGESSDITQVNIPFPEIPDTDNHIKSNLNINGSFENNILNLTVADGESQDTTQITIPLPEIPDTDNHIESNLAINSSFENNILTITVADGESQGTSQVTIPLPEIPDTDNHIKSNLSLSASWESEVLTISVADGESSGITQVNIPFPEIPDTDNHVKSNLNINGSFENNILNLTVADGESQDTTQITIPTNDSPQTIFITEEIYMNCDELERKLDDCCSEILNRINIVVAEIEDSENNINNKIDGFKNEIVSDLSNITNITTETKEYVTVDISGEINGDYFCSFQIDDKNNPVPGYALSSLGLENYEGQKNYTAKGIAGIHEILKIISRNLDSIYNDICKAIDPISSISVNDLYTYCIDNFEVDKSLYFDESGEPRYSNAVDHFNEEVKAILDNLLKETKYSYLIDKAIGDKLITAPTNWIAPILAEFALIQGKINNQAICDIDIPEQSTDVVSIVASDKVLGKYQGKTLVLHLVTFENYPKRSANSTYWQQQIPDPQTEYDWDIDFKNLVWSRGNLYCELYFNGIKDPVSGWFAGKGAADSWFDSILQLTKATERNRKYHEQKTSTRTITPNLVRPYRAFITSINDAGQGVCEVKYVPPVEDE